jgi:hypothetical protein
MKTREAVALAIVLLAIALCAPVFASEVEEDEDIRRMSKEEVRDLIGSPDATIIDVRYEKNWKKSDQKIAGAVRQHPNELGSWAGTYQKDRLIVLYCD